MLNVATAKLGAAKLGTPWVLDGTLVGNGPPYTNLLWLSAQARSGPGDRKGATVSQQKPHVMRSRGHFRC